MAISETNSHRHEYAVIYLLTLSFCLISLFTELTPGWVKPRKRILGTHFPACQTFLLLPNHVQTLNGIQNTDFKQT